MSGARIKEQGFEPATLQVEEGSRLILEEIEYRFSVFPVDDTAVREMIDRCRSLGHSLYTMAGEGGKIIAAAEVDQPENQDAMVHNIAVEEAQRGHGIGRTLMRHIAGRAAENGSEVIHIFPIDTGFFKHIGFVTDPDDDAMMLAAPQDIMRS